MEVEHYHPKALYPNEVLDWDNLLPGCKRCNGKKGKHDTKKEPIIHPSKMEPQQYLYMKNYYLRGKDQERVGETTIEVLDLNDFDRLCQVRFKIGYQVQVSLDEIKDSLEKRFLEDDKSKRKLIKKVKDLLKSGIPRAEYAATVATELCSNSIFKEVRSSLEEQQLWSEELQKLYIIMKKNNLSIEE